MNSKKHYYLYEFGEDNKVKYVYRFLTRWVRDEYHKLHPETYFDKWASQSYKKAVNQSGATVIDMETEWY